MLFIVTVGAVDNASSLLRYIADRSVRDGRWRQLADRRTRVSPSTHPLSLSSFSTHQPSSAVRTGGLFVRPTMGHAHTRQTASLSPSVLLSSSEAAKNSCSLVVLLLEGLQVTPLRQHGLTPHREQRQGSQAIVVAWQLQRYVSSTAVSCFRSCADWLVYKTFAGAPYDKVLSS